MRTVIPLIFQPLVLAACCLCSLYPALSHGQTSLSASDMVEQLKSQGAPRTRSLRNLIVEAAEVPVKSASSAPPSLSLLIQFDLNSSRVRAESRLALSNLSEALQSRELADSRFAIEGHTDATGRADYNLKLSQQRADSVRDLLARQGVTASRLTTVGKGSSEPANESDPHAAENRRVRIVNLN